MSVYGNYINNEVIQEFVTEKQARNPEYLRKIYEKGFSSVTNAISWILMVLTVAGTVAVGIFAGGIEIAFVSLIIFIFGDCALILWLDGLTKEKRDKKIQEIKEKCISLKSKYEKELENPKNEKYKAKIEQAIKELNNTLNELNRLEKQKSRELADKAKKETEKVYNSIINYLDGHPSGNGEAHEDDWFIDILIKLNFSNKQIIDYIINNPGSCKEYIDDDEMIDDYYSFCKIEDYYLLLYHNDDYIVLIDPKKKVFYDNAYYESKPKVITLKQLSSSQLDNGDSLRDWLSNEYFMELDRVKGYYLFQDVPDKIHKKHLKIYDYK